MSLLSFGKKRRTVRRRKSKKVTKKVMYAIKRTRSGRRVVKVVTVMRAGRPALVYASSRRRVASSVKCYRLKSQAKAALKKMTKKTTTKSRKTSRRKKTTRRRVIRRSGFGARRGTVGGSSRIRYGFVPCLSDNDSMMGPKYKATKFYSIKWEYETYNLIVKKEPFSDERKIYVVPDTAKKFLVKRGASKAEEKRARDKAAALAKEYTMLKQLHIDLTPVECSLKDANNAVLAAQKAGDTSLAGILRRAMPRASVGQLDTMRNSASSQINILGGSITAQSLMDDSSKRVRPPSNLANLGRYYGIGPTSMDYRGRVMTRTAGGTKEYRNPVTGSDGRAQMSPSGSKLIEWTPLFGKSRFGRRVNYGFSRFF